MRIEKSVMIAFGVNVSASQMIEQIGRFLIISFNTILTFGFAPMCCTCRSMATPTKAEKERTHDAEKVVKDRFFQQILPATTDFVRNEVCAVDYLGGFFSGPFCARRKLVGRSDNDK